MQNNIKHRWFFSHSPEVVWDHLTEPELLSQWLMPSDFHLEIGRKFMFITGARPRFGFDGKIYCQVLDFEINRRLIYSWKGGANGKTNLDSVVTWTLIPKDNGTELILEHTGFKGLRNFIPYLVMNKGWLKIVKRLSKNIDLSYDTANT